jgi:hypothetical protein
MMTSAPEELRELLTDARRRGVPWPVAWGSALHRTTAGRAQGRAWREAFTASAPAWRRAYERAPSTPADLALALLAESVNAAGAAPLERADVERPCDWCGEAIGDRRAQAVYCSEKCRRSANYARERAAA